MSSPNGAGDRTRPNKLQMLVSGSIVVATLFRLPNQHYGPVKWVNVLLLVLGVAGFLLAAFRPQAFERK